MPVISEESFGAGEKTTLADTVLTRYQKAREHLQLSDPVNIRAVGVSRFSAFMEAEVSALEFYLDSTPYALWCSESYPGILQMEFARGEWDALDARFREGNTSRVLYAYYGTGHTTVFQEGMPDLSQMTLVPSEVLKCLNLHFFLQYAKGPWPWATFQERIEVSIDGEIRRYLANRRGDNRGSIQDAHKRLLERTYRFLQEVDRISGSCTLPEKAQFYERITWHDRFGKRRTRGSCAGEPALLVLLQEHCERLTLLAERHRGDPLPPIPCMYRWISNVGVQPWQTLY